MRWVRTIDFWAVLTLFFSSLLFFYDLFGERYLLTERDLAPYFIPPRFFWVESLRQGDFPLWNPYQFSGHPFFANPQHAILYPLNGLFFLLPFDIAFNAVIILHFFLAGLFTYLFLKDLKVSSTGSLISGLILMLSGYLLSVHSLLTILLSVIWTPLIMMFFRRAMISPGIRNEILTAVFMTLSFLGGGIEVVYGNFFVLLLMVIFSINRGDWGESLLIAGKGVIPAPHQGAGLTPAGIQESTGFPRIKYGAGLVKPGMTNYLRLMSICIIRFKSLLIISILFIILSAVQLIPFLELWMHSIRGQGITYQEATVWSFAPKDIFLFFLPDAYGYFLDMKKYWITQCWLKTMYTGGLPFVLSLIFFLIPHPDPLPKGEGTRGNPLPKGEGTSGNPLPEREGTRGNPLPYGGEGRVRGIRRGRILFLSLMFFSLFLSLGQYNPLYPFVFKYVPFFNGIRYPVKFLYIFILALAITAGLGFERLMQFSNRIQKNTDPMSLPPRIGVRGKLQRESRNVGKNWIPASAGMTFLILKRLFQQPTKIRDGKGLKHLLIAFSLISGFILLFLVLGHKEVEHFLKLREIDFPQFNHLSTNLHHTKRFFFYLTLFFLLLRVGYEVGWKGWIKAFIVFFLIADLFGNMGFYGKEKIFDYLKKTRVLEIVTSDKGPFRTFSTGKTIALDSPILIGNGVPFDLIKEKHLSSLNMIFQVHDIWGVDVVRLKRSDDLYKKLISLPSISSSRLVDLYGVKYVISITPIEQDPRFELVYARLEGLEGNKEDLLKLNTIKLYRNKSPLPRAWLVKDFKVMDSKEILSAISHPNFDPRKEVLLEEEPEWPKKMGGHSGPPLQNINDVGEPLRGLPEGVEFISESNNRLSLQAKVEEEGILILSDTYYPGWKVFVNGRKEKILRANYNFRGVVLLKGTYQVEFVYAPFSFKLGAGITLVGVMVCGIIGWIDRKKDHRRIT